MNQRPGGSDEAAQALAQTRPLAPSEWRALRTTLRQSPPDQPQPTVRHEGSTVAVHTAYRLQGVLGEGGQGRVYAAEHGFLGREVAIKICAQNEGGVAARFRHEARLTASLSHPSIIAVYDAADGILVMRRLRGRTLEERLRARPDPATLPALIEVLVDVCQAVAYAHDRGIVHRDLKAANVITGDYGEVTVIDWGLAVPLVDEHLPETFDGQEVPLCAGTPACLPPECLGDDRRRVGRPADVFMLGGILYHILTGSMPYQHTTTVEATLAAAREVRLVPIEQANPQAPSRLVQAQRQAMARDPERRPTVGEFQQQLQAWLRQSGNLSEAEQSLALARLLVRRARVCTRREHELRTDCYVQALSHYDRALALVDDLPGVMAERERVLTDFIRACVLSGEITLARLLERHRRVPVMAAAPGREQAAPTALTRRRTRSA
ncbi:MAG: serine/threonine-protein kinase [Planctomycetota bacterium]|nr:serine/threonine protein kinase [Planctomycetota bacterium]MCX8040050.1 serine/threonine protein kinase [Planctomycetota bacterium]MDW8373844.1 serine/threonine-protein kinase [Planctomycetota bacterium]